LNLVRVVRKIMEIMQKMEEGGGEARAENFLTPIRCYAKKKLREEIPATEGKKVLPPD